ncbi:MAG TPA: hypothetical protein VGN53_15235 [Klebsiella sp.]|jgi:hypothetical protein
MRRGDWRQACFLRWRDCQAILQDLAKRFAANFTSNTELSVGKVWPYAPSVDKNTIELPLPTFLPADGYGFEWCLVSEDERKRKDNQLIEIQKADVSECLLPLNWLSDWDRLSQ